MMGTTVLVVVSAGYDCTGRCFCWVRLYWWWFLLGTTVQVVVSRLGTTVLVVSRSLLLPRSQKERANVQMVMSGKCE